MIYEIERIDDIDIVGIPTMFAGNKIYINTKNICSIEIYCDDKYTNEHSICKGLLINAQEYPLYFVSDYILTDEDFKKIVDEYNDWLNNIYNEIVEIMKKENG